jgi:hypothetical protein
MKMGFGWRKRGAKFDDQVREAMKASPQKY